MKEEEKRKQETQPLHSGKIHSNSNHAFELPMVRTLFTLAGGGEGGKKEKRKETTISPDNQNGTVQPITSSSRASVSEESVVFPCMPS